MVFIRRLRCHFCGSKQPGPRDLTSFKCNVCDATNFLDGKGNIVDTPVSATSSTADMLRFTSRASTSPSQQQEQVFCSRCIQNQHIYNEMLANYLPDDDDPRYHELEKKLPQFKADLEKRYPLVCSKCAPIAQQQIHQADYYGMAQNAARLCADTRIRGGRTQAGSRDSAAKKVARILLNIIRAIMYVGLLVQVIYHIYAAAYFWRGSPELYTDSSLASCAIRTMLMRFDASCSSLIGSYVPRTLMLAVFLLPYNTGHKDWFDRSIRIEAVEGQKNYFFMQLVLLFARYCAWQIQHTSTGSTSPNQDHVLAAHVFAAAFLPFAQWLAERKIEPVKWKLTGTMMPSPNEKDVLGVFAGASLDEHLPVAANDDPFRYLRRPQLNSTVVSRVPTNKLTAAQRPYPSPGPSDGEDVMETDFEPLMRSQPRGPSFQQHNIEPSHTYYNHGNSSPLGLGNMRSQLAHVEEQYRGDQERMVEEQQQRHHYAHSSFAIQPQAPQQYGSAFSRPVPPAPTSIERQYRSPWASQRPAVPTPGPVSQQKDFMDRMRAGVQPITMTGPNSDFELQKGKLRLASDNKETGLEDSFGNHFSFDDHGASHPNRKGSGWLGGLLG